MAEENVLFRVTRPNTSIFHPDRSVSLLPVQTGGEIELPRKTADYHVRNGVGVIVDAAEDASEKAPEPEQVPEEPKEPVKEPEAPTAPVKRAPGRPAKTA
jgi:hypothetical protein